MKYTKMVTKVGILSIEYTFSMNVEGTDMSVKIVQLHKPIGILVNLINMFFREG